MECPKEVLAMNFDERNSVRINFYVRKTGTTLYFLYSFPDYRNQEYIQKIWELASPETLVVMKIGYWYDGEYREDNVKYDSYNNFMNHYKLEEKDIRIIEQWREKSYPIYETNYETRKNKYFSYPQTLIEEEIQNRTFNVVGYY